MYNPIENEYYHEWFELYNPTNHSINISGWSVTDNLYKDYLEINFDYGNKSYMIPPKKYAIVTDHGTKIFDYYNISNETNCFYVDDKSIGNGLGNKGDKLVLKNNSNSTVDYVEWITNYSDIKGSPIEDIGENYTLSKIKPFKTNNSEFDYYEGIPTPGRKNILLKRGKTQINNKKTEYNLSKNEKISINLEIQNKGDFNDNITIKIKEISKGFDFLIGDKTLFLKPGEIKKTILRVNTYSSCYQGLIKIVAESEKEINESDEIEFEFIITNPDLWIKKIKCYNEDKVETNTIFQGENIRIKAFLKNLGVDVAENVIISFYKDKILPNNLIGTKFYETISKYQKYPSAYIDTINFSDGFHKIFVYADVEDNIFEIDETNNFLSFEIKIIDTRPNSSEKKLVFTEVYFHTHSGLKNEFFKIYNPNDYSINISDWYMTNEPNEKKLDQKKIVFPKNTFISSKSSLIITQSADDFRFETGFDPDFEYYVDSDEKISDMKDFVKTYFSNEKGMISFKNPFNHTVDSFCYGNISKNCLGWKAKPVDIKETLKTMFLLIQTLVLILNLIAFI